MRLLRRQNQHYFAKSINYSFICNNDSANIGDGAVDDENPCLKLRTKPKNPHCSSSVTLEYWH